MTTTKKKGNRYNNNKYLYRHYKTKAAGAFFGKGDNLAKPSP